MQQNQKYLVTDVDVVNGFKFNSDHIMVRMIMELKVKRFFTFVKHIPKMKVQENEDLIRNFNQNLKKNFMCCLRLKKNMVNSA